MFPRPYTYSKKMQAVYIVVFFLASSTVEPSLHKCRYSCIHHTHTYSLVLMQVVLDENGMSKGYGFVHFETQESADMAIQKVNGMLLNEKKV